MIISLIKSKFLPKKFQKELMLMRINVKIRRSIKKKKKKKKKCCFICQNQQSPTPTFTNSSVGSVLVSQFLRISQE